jgi:hypothetical protein
MGYINRRLRILFHAFGLSCIGGAVFLEILVFTDIIQYGFFRATEGNLVILFLEIILTAFTAIYFVYTYLHVIKSVQISHSL